MRQWEVLPGENREKDYKSLAAQAAARYLQATARAAEGSESMLGHDD